MFSLRIVSIYAAGSYHKCSETDQCVFVIQSCMQTKITVEKKSFIWN